MRDELFHHGTKGQRWGVRRYQYRDGSLTPEGRRRYGSNSSMSPNIQMFSKKKGNDSDDEKPGRLKTAESVSKNSSKAFREGIKINESVSGLRRFEKNRKMDISQMSDKELRDRVNRMNLEQNYRNLMASSNYSRGAEYTKRALEIGGAALGVTSSALGIALAIKKLAG